MVSVFIEIVVLLADSASMTSQQIESLDANNKGARKRKDSSEIAQDSGSIQSVKSADVGRTQIQNDDTGLVDTKSNDMDKESLSMAWDAKLPSENECCATQGSDFFRCRNEHIDQIYLYLSQAEQECFIVSCPEDNVDDTYNGVDRGKIIALILDSVLLRGHSTSSLQLQARNNPTKGLLIDLTLLREELDIIQRTIKKQLELVNALRKDNSCDKRNFRYSIDIDDTFNRMLFEGLYSANPDACGEAVINTSTRKLLKAMGTDLQERTEIIQRVDIIQEDHGKATLIFTTVATIFLPLSFVSSYLGMNTADIRNMEGKQVLFWEVAMPFTVVVVSVVLLVAYNVRRILGWFKLKLPST
ncbi:hypothetical protein N7528_008489 [Penicillium herquei]|nr:hypothetical protein N7528_008489 [Penicillium herquei]